eukprot:9476854-Pyramimonas_sp.AAC.1
MFSRSRAAAPRVHCVVSISCASETNQSCVWVLRGVESFEALDHGARCRAPMGLSADARAKPKLPCVH